MDALASGLKLRAGEKAVPTCLDNNLTPSGLLGRWLLRAFENVGPRPRESASLVDCGDGTGPVTTSMLKGRASCVDYLREGGEIC